MTTLGPDRFRGVGSHTQDGSPRSEPEEFPNAVSRYPRPSARSHHQHPSDSGSTSVPTSPSSTIPIQSNLEYTRRATYQSPNPTAMPISAYHVPAAYPHHISLDRQTESPAFEQQHNHRRILFQNVSVEPLLKAKIQKGFFLSSDHVWTCYRRNYFAVELSYTFQPWTNGGFLDLVDASGKERTRIQALAINVSASRDMPLGPSIELVQHTSKRDKGPIMAMEKIYLHPRPPAGSYSRYKNERRKRTSSLLVNLGPVLPGQVDLSSHDSRYEHTLERLQFKSATANNGKRRVHQQYFFLNVELWANTSSKIDPCWSKVADISSAPLVVRGRSPSHYSSDVSNVTLPLVDHSALPNTSRNKDKGNDISTISPTFQEVDDEQLRQVPRSKESQSPEEIGDESLHRMHTDSEDAEEDLRVHVSTKGPARSPTTLQESEHEQQSQVIRANESRLVPFYSKIYRLVRTLLNAYQRFWRPKIVSGHVRVSWECRCEKSLYADVEENRAAALVDFVKHAVNPSHSSSISVNYSSDSSKSSSPQDDGLSSSYNSINTPNTRITLPSPVATNDSDNFVMPLPLDQELYVLLCVNTDVHRIDLAHVDVQSDFSFGTRRMRNDRYLFDKMREEYSRLRHNRAAGYFVKPKTIQFIKFEVLRREISGVCVGNFEMGKIPSKSEAIKFGYHFSPCPPLLGDLPVMPHIFMHSFLEPGDHTGSLMMNRLPKKTGTKLLHGDWPGYGWGIYIVEGYNWKLLRLCAMSILVIVTILTLIWSILKGDVQGGFGMGQYCLAVLALIVPAYVLEQAQ